MKKVSTLFFTLIASSITFVACSSDEESATQTTTDPATVIASMTIDAANSFDVQKGIEISSESSETKKTISESCAVITVDNANSYPKVFTVDFGSNGCTAGAITRRGKLKITITSSVLTTGSKMTIERIDYSINKLKLEGTIEYTNTTTDAKVPQWTRKVTNGKFTNGSGAVFLNSGSYTTKQTAGVDTPFLLTDNIYELTEGKHVVTNEVGTTLTLTITESLVKKYSCDFISKGKLKLEGGLLNGIVDYGNNDCDSDYTYTHENGYVFDLKM